MKHRNNRTVVPSKYEYFDKYKNVQLAFTPKPDELVITFQETGDSLEEADTTMKNTLREGPFANIEKVNSKRGIAVCQVNDDTESLELAGAIDLPSVANSIPALEDSDGLTRYFIPDEITVQFQPGVGSEGAEQIIHDLGCEVIVKQRTEGYYTISVPDGKSLFDAINMFSEHKDVLFSEASEISFNDALISPPNDPYFNRLWGLSNQGQTVRGVSGQSGVDINALEAWDTTQGDPDVIISVIDTGMDINHPDLNPNLLSRNNEDWDFASNDGIPQDEGSHGTHVCGTAAAVMNNSTGITGVAPGCKIMPLRINLQAGMNQNRADAINYVMAQAKQHTNKNYVVNCSWRASGNYNAILYAITNAVNNGVLVIFAAGNASNDMDVTPQFPGVYQDVIAVAALDANNRKASFSNYGSQVDVSAPGVNIWSTVPPGNYSYKNGTSMAAPHVAGVAALVWSANKNLTNLEVRHILESTCSDVDQDNPSIAGKLGKGRVNAAQAVNAAAGPLV